MSTIFLSAGEASGEHYGALLIESIRRLAPDSQFFGLGGQRMEALGMERVVRAEDVAVMGITEVVRYMPRIYGEYRRLKASIREKRPDVAVLIDFPDVNLRLARELHRLHIPVIFFVSPQLWAWKKRRIHKVRRYVDRMLVIFPFEEQFYRARGIAAEFVGHPLADLPAPAVSREEYARRYKLDPDRQWIGLLPGSRPKEIALNLPEMLMAAAALEADLEFLLPLASTITESQGTVVQNEMDRGTNGARPGPRITLVHDARATLHHARASIVASGTATVEAALIGNPFVVVYRLSRLSYAVARRVVKVPFVAMVNLVAGREVVPELIQDNFTAANIVLRLRPLLQDETARQAMQTDLGQVAALLRNSSTKENAIDRVASITMQMITGAGRGEDAYPQPTGSPVPGNPPKQLQQKSR
jgi:lipid-A-disaccharide synthase